MKKITFVIIALLFWKNAPAQEPIKIAALDSLLRTELPDTTRASKLSELSYHISSLKPDTARMLGLEAMALAQKTGHGLTIGKCEKNLGWVEFRQGNAEEGKRLMQSAIQRFRVLGSNNELSTALSKLGQLYLTESDLPQAFQCLEESLKLAEKSGDPLLLADVYKNLGRIYQQQDKPAEARKYYGQAMGIFEKNKRADLVADILCSLGSLCYGEEDFNGALDFYKKALTTGESTANLLSIAAISKNIGSAYVALQKFPEAFLWYEKVKDIYEGLDNQKALITLQISLGYAYLKKGDIPRAIIESNIGLKAAAKNHFADLELHFCNNLTEMACRSGDYYTAYTVSQRAQAISDSLYKTDKEHELLELQTKFETAQKGKELQAKTLETERLRSFIAVGALALALLLVLSIGLWRQTQLRRRTNEQLLAKNLEVVAARERAEHSEAVKKQFLANMSHEIRTPLNALAGISNLLANRPIADEKTAHYHQILQKSSENLLVIVNDILDFSKLEAGKLRLEIAPFCLPDLLKHTVDMFQDKALEKGIGLKTEFAPDLPGWVMGNLHYLSQVLNNLLSNAIKFTQKGEIRLKVEGGQETVNGTHTPLAFSIADTGIGISPEKTAQVFESFSQVGEGAARQLGGTGLGLAISKEIVTLMGGSLLVKSRLGVGSEFYFVIELPTTEAPVNQSLGLGFQQKPRLQLTSSLHILLAEDNAYNQIVATDSLHQLSPEFQISAVTDGQAALALLEKSPFDLLFLDLQMPIMDGYELTRRLREHPDARLRSLPIIALTASVVGAEIERCFQSGMDGYVAKPFRLIELASEMVRVLPEKTAFSVAEKQVPDHANQRVTDLAKFHSLTADLPGQHDSMLQILVEGLAAKLAPLEAALGNGDQLAFAQIIHALRPLTISVGMDGVQDSMTQMETEWDSMAAKDWRTQAQVFTSQVNHAVNELRNIL